MLLAKLTSQVAPCCWRANTVSRGRCTVRDIDPYAFSYQA